MIKRKKKRPAVLFTKATLITTGVGVHEKYKLFNKQLKRELFKKDDPNGELGDDGKVLKVSVLPDIPSLYDRKNLSPFLIEVIDPDFFNPLFKDWHMVNLKAISYIPLEDLNTTAEKEKFPDKNSLTLGMTSVLLITQEIRTPTDNHAFSGGTVIIMPIEYLGVPSLKFITPSEKGMKVEISNGEVIVYSKVTLFDDEEDAAKEGEDDGGSPGALILKGFRVVFTNIKPDDVFEEGESPDEIIVKTIIAIGLYEKP